MAEPDPDPQLAELPDHRDDDTAAGEPPVRERWGLVRFARMAGSSIAGRDAAPWITDFLNAAYFRRPVGDRQVDDLRLAFSVLTTFWWRMVGHPRLRSTDLGPFHRAFGGDRFDTVGSRRGTLSPVQLLDGAARLLGEWFGDAYGDAGRRGWGIVFPTAEERGTYDPEVRLRLAHLGALTPGSAPPEAQTWHTYPPVAVPSAEGAIAALTAPETWPDFASEIGRFTPLRRGGLAGQTFEIEVAAGTGAVLPVFTRGYVTITELVTSEHPEAQRRWFEELETGLARYGAEEPRAVPEGAEPLVGFDLTTHAGHFMGAGHNRLLLYTDEHGAWLRAAGTWDPMPWHIAQTYKVAGRTAQHAFWGQGGHVAQSMLHQLALHLAE